MTNADDWIPPFRKSLKDTRRFAFTILADGEIVGEISLQDPPICRSTYDIVVEMPPDAYQMVHMKDELEEMLLGSVDLIRYNKFLNPRLRERIDREAIYV